MIKEVVVLNGDVINIGPWDYMVKKIEIEPGEYDDEGKVIKAPVYEEQVTNPLPLGAVIEQREIEATPDGGLIVKGTARPSETELLGAELAQLKIQGMQQQQMISSLGAELAAAKLEIINLKGVDSA
ncbi:hypothetical protein [Paenibacillus sp. FSL K6-0108]|uniref:hypothetical protein n=1 Tax=Paenibacillus sp. FSL K6-0108 TaxID=2921417 RepID=UPI00324FDB41